MAWFRVGCLLDGGTAQPSEEADRHDNNGKGGEEAQDQSRGAIEWSARRQLQAMAPAGFFVQLDGDRKNSAQANGQDSGCRSIVERSIPPLRASHPLPPGSTAAWCRGCSNGAALLLPGLAGGMGWPVPTKLLPVPDGDRSLVDAISA